MIGDGPALLDVAHAPEIETHAVEERHDRNDGEGPCRCQRNVVAKVQQCGSDRAEDDGEFELEHVSMWQDCMTQARSTYPSQERPLSGERDLRLNPDRYMDLLAFRSLEALLGDGITAWHA